MLWNHLIQKLEVIVLAVSYLYLSLIFIFLNYMISSNKDLIKIIGKNDTPREEALLSCLIDVEGLFEIFNRDFNDWSDFDSWDNIGVQQWIFARAMELNTGKKIDIQCNCCEYKMKSKIKLYKIDDQKCFGVKSIYMIKKVLNEILLAKARRDCDGTYSA